MTILPSRIPPAAVSGILHPRSNGTDPLSGTRQASQTRGCPVTGFRTFSFTQTNISYNPLQAK